MTSDELRALADTMSPAWYASTHRPWRRPIAALGPDAARLLADAMDWIDTAIPDEHHPACAVDLPQAECDCGVEDRDALLARFAALGKGDVG